MPIHVLNADLKPHGSLRRAPDFSNLLDNLGDNQYAWKTKTYDRSLVPIESDLPQGDGVGYQRNYMAYLTRCWAEHRGVVIEPNHVWFTLLCELALRVKADPETYRDIFTTSADKQEIAIPWTGPGFAMDMGVLIHALKAYVPTDTAAFFPDFTTSTHRSTMARYAAFADMASPYYDYFMLACGFPAIDVQGTEDDWMLMDNAWSHLSSVFTDKGLRDYFGRVEDILANCAYQYDKPEWWKGIYKNRRCGSGGEVAVSGWFSDLFYEKCDLAKPENFPPCVATVPYTASTGASRWNFKMVHGLFSAVEQDGFLIPDFGHVVFNVLDKPEVFRPEMINRSTGTFRTRDEPVYRLEPDNVRQTAQPRTVPAI